MPNWCSTKIKISHDEDVINRLSTLLGEWTRENYCDNGFGLGWLGNIVGNSGIGDPMTSTISCRGRLSDWYTNGNDLIIYTETAWTPMLEMWVRVVDMYAEGATLIYEAEEPGECLYATNDENLAGRYIIESCDGNFDSEYEATEEKLIGFLHAVMGLRPVFDIKLKDLMSALDNQLSHCLDKKFFINQWEFCPVEDYY